MPTHIFFDKKYLDIGGQNPIRMEGKRGREEGKRGREYLVNFFSIFKLV
jgi:hypothetical protein